MASYSLIVVLVIAIWSGSSDGRPRSSSDGSSLSKRQTTGCGQTGFYSNEGFIKTPNYPGNYGNGMDCVYTIQPNATIQYVNFYTCDCELEDSLPSCVYDFIQFGSQKTCGSQSGQSYNVYSNTSKVEVAFRSDGSVTRKGCNVAYAVNKAARNCPVINSTTPTWNNTTPIWNNTTPSWNTSTPSWNNTSPSWNTTTGNNTSWNVTFPTPTTPNLWEVQVNLQNLERRMNADWETYKTIVWGLVRRLLNTA